MRARDEELAFGGGALRRCHLASALRSRRHVDRGRLVDVMLRLLLGSEGGCKDLGTAIRMYSLVQN